MEKGNPNPKPHWVPHTVKHRKWGVFQKQNTWTGQMSSKQEKLMTGNHQPCWDWIHHYFCLPLALPRLQFVMYQKQKPVLQQRFVVLFFLCSINQSVKRALKSTCTRLWTHNQVSMQAVQHVALNKRAGSHTLSHLSRKMRRESSSDAELNIKSFKINKLMDVNNYVISVKCMKIFY